MQVAGYDRDLADRVAELIAEPTAEPIERPVTERRMFGGLAFMVGGKMAVVVSGQGGLMVRVDPSDGDQLVTTTEARRAVMREREMRGWLRIDAEHLDAAAELAAWVDRGLAAARRAT